MYRKIFKQATKNKELLIFAAGVATAIVGKKILESKVVKDVATDAVAGVMSIKQDAEARIDDIKEDAEAKIVDDEDRIEIEVEAEEVEEKPKSSKKSKKSKK